MSIVSSILSQIEAKNITLGSTDIESTVEQIGQNLLALLIQETQIYWKEMDTGFLTLLATQIAQEEVGAVIDANKKAEHQENLKFLIATVEGELVKREIMLVANAKPLLQQIIQMIIKTVTASLLS